MFYSFLHGAIFHGRQKKIFTASQSYRLFCIFQNNPSILSLRLFSTTSNRHSFTVSYLINKCGLSPESAFLVSKVVDFETPDKPDSVIAFFKNHGFSEPQITSLIRSWPRVLLSDVKKTILPKLQFLKSKGVSSPDLAKILGNHPTILSRSLENHISPSFNFLSNLLKSDEAAIKENVEKVKEMGFNPMRMTFVVAILILNFITKSKWDRKFYIYKKCGWSEKEIVDAFRKYPSFISVSEEKILKIMDFLVNKMGLQSSVIAKYPRVITQSLEKRIVPREESFIEKFVNRYKADAPELLKLYQEKFHLSNNWKAGISRLQRL
ncbi:hypothetical protein CRYUN_Cryun10bG0018800 [Craigia yunnanensis]